MNNMMFCQSCGMPMGKDDSMYGTNKDGSKNLKYCRFCFADGNFLKDCTMDEMIEFCLPFYKEARKDMSEDILKKEMKNFFPNLERWTN